MKLKWKNTRREPAPVSADPRAFDVKLLSPILSAGTYRVFVERSDLLFIQIEGGAKGVLSAVAPLLGPSGSVIPLVLWLFTKGKAKARKQRLDEADPEQLLRESNSNFRLNVAEIRDATIDTAGFFFTRSEKGGRLNFSVRHGEKIKCRFETALQMSRAIQLLPPLLNSTLKVSVQWNRDKDRFDG